MAYLTYSPTPTGKLFHLDNSPFRGIMGPLGSGKSTACVLELFFRACTAPPNADGVRRSKAAVIRNTERMLRDTTMETFFEWLPKGAAGTWLERDMTFFLGGDKPGMIVLPDGTRPHCEILFRAIDREEQYRNLLSLEINFAWLNEFREINFSIIKNLWPRTRYKPKGQIKRPFRGIFMDTNPFPVESEWYKFFVEHEIGEIDVRTKPQLFIQPGGLDEDAENLENLPGGRQYYLDMLATSNDQQWIDMHVHGKFGHGVKGTPVFQREFNRDLHVSDQELLADKRLPLGIGLDFGITPAAVVTQLDADSCWAILDELVSERAGAVQFSRRVKRFLEQRYPGFDCFFYGDPAGNQRSQVDLKTVFDAFESAGIHVMPSEKSISARLESIRRALTNIVGTKPGMLISPRCTKLIAGFSGAYAYSDKVSRKKGAPEPIKNEYSHVHDALQYIVAPFEWPAIKGLAKPTWGSGDGKPLQQSRVKTDFNVFAL